MENVIKYKSALDILLDYVKATQGEMSEEFKNMLREENKNQLKIAYERGAFDYVTSRQNFDNYYKEKYGEQI